MTGARINGESSVALMRYDAACLAIANAKAVDEAKQIRDVSIAMKAYARQAKNRQLELDAAEIRMRAERRVGELMEAQREGPGLAPAGRPSRIGSAKDPISRPATLAEAGIDKHLAHRARKLAAMPRARFDDMVAKLRTPGDTMPTFVATAHKSETPEHYTPPSFLEAVYRVFDGVPDLDPCAESKTNPNVPAKRVFTRAEDGLARPWSGRVFMNPPYGREIGDWTQKLRAEWQRGMMTEAIALLPARTDTEWMDALTADTDDAVLCFLHGRLTFVGNTDPAPFPSLVVYFGPKHDLFAEVFWDLGLVMPRPPKEFFISHA